MKNILIIEISLKNLLKKRTRFFITVGGLALAVSIIVFFLGLGYGIEKMVINDFSSIDALRAIDVTAEKSNQIVLDDAALNEFDKLETVVETYPIVEIGGKIEYENSKTDVAIIAFSSDTVGIWDSFDLKENVDKESFSSNKVIVSRTALNLLNQGNIVSKDVGLEIILEGFVTNEDNEPDEIIGEEAVKNEEEAKLAGTFTVIDIEESSDSPVILLPLEYLEQNGLEKYSIVKVLTNESNNVAETRIKLEKMGYKTRTAQDTIDEIDEIFDIIRLGLAIFGIIAVGIATLGMFNTLTVSLLEKTREIGILKALGTQKNTVIKLFLAESLTIAMLGAIAGIIIGIVFSLSIQFILNCIAHYKGFDMSNVFNFPPEFIVTMIATMFVVGLLTGFYPARKASSLDTLEALRYE